MASTLRVRDGCAASALSNSSSSRAVACFEYTLKFTPPLTTVAPSGAGEPGAVEAPARSGEKAASDSSVVFMILLALLARLGSRRLRGLASKFHVRLRVDLTEQRDERRHQTRPACLMARAKTRTVVAVEVLVEQDVIAPVRVLLEDLRTAVDRP